MIEFALAVLAVALGAIVQGISGVGGGFIMVPLLAMIDVTFLPGPVVFASLTISTLMAWRERRHIDMRMTVPIMLSFIPGSMLGAALLGAVDSSHLGVLFGGTILFAVVLSLTGLDLPLNRFTGSIAGALAGAMGASTGLGAPVLAVLYQRQPGPMVRSTLAFLYTVASLLIVTVLFAYGRFGPAQVLAGAQLVPGFLLGYLCSRPLALHFDRQATRYDRRATRYIVLAVSGAAAVSLILSSL